MRSSSVVVLAVGVAAQDPAVFGGALPAPQGGAFPPQGGYYPPPGYYPPQGGGYYPPFPPQPQPPFPPQPQPPYNGPQYPTVTDPAMMTQYYTSQRNYLVDRPQFGAPVIGPITGIKMPRQEAHDLAKSYPMAYFPQNAAIHPPADDAHVETFYHTHDHTHLVDWQGNLDMSSYNNGHPFVLPGVANHPDVVQEHEDAFQHGHIHYHIVEGTDPCGEGYDDDDCGDTEDLAAILLEAAAAAAVPPMIYAPAVPMGVYGTTIVAADSEWSR